MTSIAQEPCLNHGGELMNPTLTAFEHHVTLLRDALLSAGKANDLRKANRIVEAIEAAVIRTST